MLSQPKTPGSLLDGEVAAEAQQETALRAAARAAEDAEIDVIVRSDRGRRGAEVRDHGIVGVARVLQEHPVFPGQRGRVQAEQVAVGVRRRALHDDIQGLLVVAQGGGRVVGVAADQGIVGRGAGQDITGRAVGSDAGEAALRRAQRGGRGPDHAEPEEDVAAAVGRDRRVDEDGGIEGGGPGLIVGESRIEDPPDGDARSIGVGAVDVVDRPARAGIVETAEPARTGW